MAHFTLADAEALAPFAGAGDLPSAVQALVDRFRTTQGWTMWHGEKPPPDVIVVAINELGQGMVTTGKWLARVADNSVPSHIRFHAVCWRVLDLPTGLAEIP